MARKLEGHTFDVVADFIAFVPEQLERDYRLFREKTRQFIYISSYIVARTPVDQPQLVPFLQKPGGDCRADGGFPVTIVRPSHTYSERSVPLGVHGPQGSYQVIRRCLPCPPAKRHEDPTQPGLQKR